ncbi:GIY-YIG nuclease family protein [Massilia sp. erpn]|uniref:GIY-YIG nuclease family protein n=1 Tax=Massilia sp. erpn TaxID=2738142 RepID=UPI002101E6CD|nr:GIY-YIG nuclease family protein [Massilia sp. erpn]UTY59784.1 GIY-YIG nuclease family protein [Massilia sp. erpn]
MNQQFEFLPFAPERWEMEGEVYGRRSGRGGVMAGGRALALPRSRGAAGGLVTGARGAGPSGPGRPPPWPAPHPRFRQRHPRPRPYYGGSWLYGPFGYVLRDPFAALEPSLMPDDGDAAGAQDDGGDEVPPTLAATLGRLPAAQRPSYIAMGNMASALADPRTAGAGFYLIEFTANGQRRAYSGQTDNLRRRLQQHALCGQMMGLPLSAHQVYIAPSSIGDSQRRAIERRIHDDMFRSSPGVLTNQRRELELEVLGEIWT